MLCNILKTVAIVISFGGMCFAASQASIVAAVAFALGGLIAYELAEIIGNLKK